jgi:hypothetical protein
MKMQKLAVILAALASVMLGQGAPHQGAPGQNLSGRRAPSFDLPD